MRHCLSGMCVSYNRHRYRQPLIWGVSNLFFLVVWPTRCISIYTIAWPKQMEKISMSLGLREQRFMGWVTQALCIPSWHVHTPEMGNNNKCSTSDGCSLRNTHLALVHKICLPRWLPLRECPNGTNGTERRSKTSSVQTDGKMLAGKIAVRPTSLLQLWMWALTAEKLLNTNLTLRRQNRNSVQLSLSSCQSVLQSHGELPSRSPAPLPTDASAPPTPW